MGVARMIVLPRKGSSLPQSSCRPFANVSLERWANFCPLLSCTENLGPDVMVMKSTKNRV